uniref:Uncharacterized protein n=1 Tax=Oryza brachyantha TaxID=4533 RepID=J3M8Z9_ORYBR
MSSGEQAAVESGGCQHHQERQAATESAKKLWRVTRAVYLVLVKGLGKHQPKLAALGVHLHQMMSSRGHGGGRHHPNGHGLDDLREHPALLTYLSSTMSCRSMDPAAAVRITDSPFPAWEEGGGDDDDDEGRLGVVDRRADEFIMWFHEELRMQQQRAAAKERSTYFLVR